MDRWLWKHLKIMAGGYHELIQGLLRLSDFAWQEKGIWYGLSHSAGIVAKVADFGADEQGLCEIFMKGF
jgi:hypothetical protein